MEKRANLKCSDDIFKDILSPLSERGEVPYTYCYRIMGCNDEEHYLKELVILDENLRSLGNYLFFDQEIKIPSRITEIEPIQTLLKQATLKDYRSGALLNILETRGFFSPGASNPVNLGNREAFALILDLYRNNEKTVNESKLANFTAKMLLWLGAYGKQLEQASAFNPKVVYWGSPKTHEVYFLIFMSLVGCDVLVLNTSFDDQFAAVDKNQEFSRLLSKEHARPISAFPRPKPSKDTRLQPEKISYSPQDTGVQHTETQQNAGPSFETFLLVKLKKSDTPLKDILYPLNKRSNYVGGAYPILPTFFTRYIGAPASQDDWQAEYLNSLYSLDQVLRSEHLYLKFDAGIPPADSMESKRIPADLRKGVFQSFSDLLAYLLQKNLLPTTDYPLVNQTIQKVFVDTVNLFALQRGKGNLSIIQNFIFKLLTWFNRYLPKLLEDNRSRSGFQSGDYTHNPKILFYGTIKAQEIYLLYALHNLGGDVLFIHPDHMGDDPFRQFDPDNILTQVLINKHSLALVPFPEEERLVRKSTVAYQASKEIEEVIYSEEHGLFKPWQFEQYTTQPITLKTTLDELKILWPEPAKVRPEFKIQNQKVYVPNLFAKINGVGEDMELYWENFRFLATAPHTKLLEHTPFTQADYTRQELFRASYLLNSEGFFDPQKVMESHLYRFQYLKIPLQQFLLTKINELLALDMFAVPVDERFKLNVLMTILTMDDALLKLLEVFDYPQEIPKLLVYDNDKHNFSENDAILLAYFNLVGLDILILTPTNYRTIEQYIKMSFLQIHQLPRVQYDLVLPPLNQLLTPAKRKSGLFSRLFK